MTLHPNTSKRKQVIEAFEKYSKLLNPDLDYSKSVYSSSTNHITITCPIHGDFEQRPHIHFSGEVNCPQCQKDSTKVTQKEFLSRAKEIHGDKYGYSKTIINGMRNNVIMTCPIHGDFKQTPHQHIGKKAGCKKCYYEIIGDSKRATLESFIEKANNIHNNKYDYSKATYINSTTKIKIICPEHGEFMQIPADHLSGHGCKHCGYEVTAEYISSNLEEFIEKANLKHDNKYNYDTTVYISQKTPIDIICPHHGVFTQMPSDHLQGNGCQICANHRKRAKYINEPTILYYLYFPKQNLYKIGITLVSRGIRKRYYPEKGLEYEILLEKHFATGKLAYEKENEIIKKFSDFKYKGPKFFVKGGESECFTKDVLNLKDEDIVKSA